MGWSNYYLVIILASMCFTIPNKVLEIKDDTVTIETPAGTRQTVKSAITLEPGDYCIVQPGGEIKKMEKKEAKELFNLLK